MAAQTAQLTKTAAPAPQVQLSFKRSEIKYLLTDAQRDRLMQAMEAHMVPDEYGPSTVRNIYYDTPTNLLVRRSIEGRSYKEKVRTRSYGAARPGDPVFLELKKKVNGVVYKRRATMDPNRAAAMLAGNGAPVNQIERELDFAIRRYGGLVPATFLAYDREAFYAPDDRDFRMTFDRGLRYRTYDVTLGGNDEGTYLMPADQSILEVKTTKAMPLWLVRFLSEEKLFKASFSKIGRAYQREQQLAKEATASWAPVDRRIATQERLHVPRHARPLEWAPACAAML